MLLAKIDPVAWWKSHETDLPMQVG